MDIKTEMIWDGDSHIWLLYVNGKHTESFWNKEDLDDAVKKLKVNCQNLS